MSGTLIQTAPFSNASWSSPFNATAPSNFTAGSTVVVTFAHSGNGTTRVTGVTVGGTAATKVYDTDNGGNTIHGEMWIAEAVVGGTNAITITSGAGSNFRINGSADEWTNLKTSPLDAQGESVQAGAVTTITATAAGASAQADEVAYFLYATTNNNPGTITAPAGYTQLWKNTANGGGLGGYGGYKILSSIATETATASGFTSSSCLAFIVTLKAGAPTPSITGTSTASPTHGGSMTITGINFGATQGTKTLKVGGTVCTPSAWSNTSITVSVDRGLNKYGSALNVEIWDGTLLSNSFAISGIQPPAGWSYVNIVSVSGTGLTALPALAGGDQVAYQTTGTPSGTVVVYADTDYTVSEFVTSFQCEGWTPTYGWGDTATQSIGSPPSSGARSRRSLYGSLMYSFKR